MLRQHSFGGRHHDTGAGLAALLRFITLDLFRSGFLPRFIGVWLMINCFGYLILFFTALFFPAYNDKVFLYLQPVFFGELAIMLYLLIKGARVPTLSAQAA